MQAVILAGGLGTRLRPLTDSMPKVMVPVLGKPFIGYLLELLSRGGVDEAVLCLGYLAEKVMDFVGDGDKWGIRINYSVEDTPLGTAGALKYAGVLLNDAFLVVNGDTYLPINYRDLMENFLKSGKEGMVTIYGDVNAGVLALKREALRFIPPGERCDLEDVLYPKLIEARQVAARITPERFYDIGTFDGIRALEDCMRGVLLKLEIGAGEFPRPGYVHNDILPFPHIEYVCPAWEVPLPDSSCEEIFLYGVWEHFRYDEARKALDKFRKLLAPGGLLRFTTPDIDLMFKYWVDRCVRHLKGRPWKEQRDFILGALWGGHCREGMVHQWGWCRETIEEILDEFGFDVLLIESNTWGPYAPSIGPKYTGGIWGSYAAAESFLGQCPGQSQPWTHLNVVAKRR